MITRGSIICDIVMNLGEILENLKEKSFTGALKLEVNFHNGNISKKLKYGTIETTTLSKE